MNTVQNYLFEYHISLTNDSGYEMARPKDLIYTHTGIILGRNWFTGKIMVFHNHPKSGPAIVVFEEFANGYKCEYTNREMGTVEDVLLRSFNQVQSGAKYKPVGYNCHNASSYARTGVSNSHGLNNTLLVLGLVALISSLK